MLKESLIREYLLMSNQAVKNAITAFSQGHMVLVTDAHHREDEADLIIAAEKVTSDAINFMCTHGKGLICLALTETKADTLNLPLQLRQKSNPIHHHTAFTLSIDARRGIKTGISAKDRAHTIETVMKDDCTPHDLIVPGHIFPLRAQQGGVLVRPGHTEAAVDLALLAGLKPAGVICEVIDDQGEMLRGDAVKAYAAKHDIPLLSIEELIAYLKENPLHHQQMTVHNQTITIAAETPLVTEYGKFTCMTFFVSPDPHEHVALIAGDPATWTEPLVRIHSECLTGDVLGSLQCDCGAQKALALKAIAEKGGVFIYLRQEGRGIGLTNKIKAYAKQHHQDLDTVEANVALGLPADDRDYHAAALLLQHLGINHMHLLTNNPTKITSLQQYITKITRVPLLTPANPHNTRYLQTKQRKFGHWLKDE